MRLFQDPAQVIIGWDAVSFRCLDETENVGARLHPCGVLAKGKFMRPITKDLMERSAKLLEISSRPS